MFHHPVFQKFTPWAGMADGQYSLDFLGVKTNPAFYHTLKPVPAGFYQTKYPPNYPMLYEWIATLTAVLEAKDRFVMAELGAGWGTWIVRAALAVRAARQIPFHLIGVEGNPAHYEYMLQHFKTNGLDPREHALIHGVVEEKEGVCTFMDVQGAESYGSCIAAHTGPARKDAVAREVPAYTIGQLLAPHDGVDLVHMDIQGAELRVIKSSLDVLSAKVRVLCVGTHSKEIDAALPPLLTGAQWLPRWIFPRESTYATSWGVIEFRDGCHVWINRRFL